MSSRFIICKLVDDGYELYVVIDYFNDDLVRWFRNYDSARDFVDLLNED